jgi:hypothetical protein
MDCLLKAFGLEINFILLDSLTAEPCVKSGLTSFAADLKDWV